MTDEDRAEVAERQMAAGGGCYMEAWSRVIPSEAFREEFGDAMEDAYERAEADPRFVKAEADWSACMAERGHALASRRDMLKYLHGDNPFGGEISEFQKRVQKAGGDFIDTNRDRLLEVWKRNR